MIVQVMHMYYLPTHAAQELDVSGWDLRLREYRLALEDTVRILSRLLPFLENCTITSTQSDLAPRAALYTVTAVDHIHNSCADAS